MHTTNPSGRFLKEDGGTRPATADVRRALIMEQRLASTQGPRPSRFATAARTALAVLALGAILGIVAVVGLALFIFTLGVVVAATAALLVVTLIDRLRGRPARRMAVPVVFVRRH